MPSLPYRTTIATQHIVDTFSGLSIGIEIFVRIITPSGEITAPCQPNLTGQWPAIDKRIAKTVQQLYSRGVFDHFGGFISINIAAETLRDPAAMQALLPLYTQLDESFSGGLTIEVSESACDYDIERHWQALSQSVTSIALDDYGKAGSTPERLNRFDWCICKADHPDVLRKESFSEALANHHLVIVENIESRQDALHCRRQGFDAQQGYWHHRPLVLPPSLMQDTAWTLNHETKKQEEGESNALG
ncbi:EAL domain-containing protein [Vreelandella massiliensis]|uniref:EAL domain-containing protein n=1 Tax=Vreelandella massiliensis TaxID=1816686 RepID=UPI00096A9229|nr:EAL domain-containing protein [Halomonas massiliensis]